jgi:hypothetical protein
MPYRNGILSTSTFDGQREILAAEQKKHSCACGLIWRMRVWVVSSHALSRHVLTNIL